MGNDIHLPNLCGTPFWNVSASWQTTTPSLTPCFVDTLLSWVPVLFLWTNALYLLYEYIKSGKPISAPFPTRWRSIKGQFAACLSGIVAVQLAFFAIASLVGEHWSVPLPPAKIITAFLNLGTALLLCPLFTLHSFSGAIWFYLLLRAICGALSLPTYWQYRHHSHPFTLLLTLSGHSIELVLLLLCSVAEESTQGNEDQGRTSVCLKEKVSFPSRLTFSWFDRLVIRSYRTSLTPDTLWDIRLPDKASILFGQFNAFWKHPSFETKDAEKTEKDTSITTKVSLAKADFQLTEKKKTPSSVKQLSPRLMGILVRQFAGYFFLPCLGRFIADCLALASPLLMKCLISFASDPASPTWHGLFYCCLLVVSSLGASLTSAYQQHRMAVLGMRIRTSLTSAIYRKAFLLAPQCRRQCTTGELVNLVAVDCQRFVDLLPFLNFLWTAPVQIGLALWLLWTELGVAVLSGLLLLVACIPVNALAMKQVERLQGKQMTLKDRRLKALSEMLSTMKLLKLYAWEEVVRAPIEQLRTQELQCIRRAGYLTTLTKVLSYTAPFMVTCLTFALYVFLNGEQAKLTAEKAFVSVALFNLLRVPFAQIPNKWASLMVTLVAMKRLDSFLASKETTPYIERQPSVGVAIQLDDASFTWQPGTLDAPSSSPTLSSLTLTIPQGSLVAIVGSVGSGKSSLLSALLGQMVKVSGRVQLAGGEQSTIGYVPQQAWIQQGSVRENILFGQPYDETRYEKVLSACALQADLISLPAGDATEIGERGANLSGGQKQRLGIARACYSQADLFLFDDSLSAVDSHVGKHIFEQVLHSTTGLLRGRTRLLVTNALFVLPTVDQIVFLKEGHIEATGTYEQLCSSCPEFAQLCANNSTKQIPNGSTGLPASPNEARPIEKSLTIAGSPTAGSNTDKVKGQLVEAEKSAKGEVSLAIYGKFLRPLGYGWSVGILLSYGLMILSGYGASFWLAHWTQAVDGAQVVTSSQTRYFLLLYGLIGSAQFLSGAAGWLSILYGTLRASNQLHSRLVSSLLQAPMSFFEATPLGRIVNRFSSDVDKLDTVIPVYLRILVNNGFTLLGTLVTVAITTPTFLLIILPVTLLYGALQRFYIATSRQLKRLESVSRSPVLTHLSESINGVAVIEAFTARERFIGESDRRVDESTRVQYPSAVATCWLQVRLDALASLLIFGAAICAVLSRRNPGDTGEGGGLSGSDIGLSLSYILNVTQTLYWCVRSYTELEANLVAVERIVEYTSLPAEAPRTRDADDARLPPDWPSKGALTFDAYSTRYRPSLPPVLSNITLAVQPNEKVSVVGRTGAGKSSLSLALFRLLEPTSGQILVDAVDIAQLGLHRLRSSLAILPQEPLLLAGSLRRNLDPFQRHSDADLWEALSLSHLKSFIASSGQGLEYAVHTGGENLSAGQRQLLCLARVLLQKPRLLVLDEATSSIDLETARLVEKTLRSQLLNCTVLSIAHRLDSVLDSDRVLVLAEGKIAELDTPTRLLSNPDTIFYSMARDAGIV